MVRYVNVICGVVLHDMVRNSMVLCGALRCGLVLYGVVWHMMVISYILAASAPIRAFLELFLQAQYFSKPLAAFKLNHSRNNERGMNPVAMTIINHQREYGWVRDRTSDLLFSSPPRY